MGCPERPKGNEETDTRAPSSTNTAAMTQTAIPEQASIAILSVELSKGITIAPANRTTHYHLPRHRNACLQALLLSGASQGRSEGRA